MFENRLVKPRSTLIAFAQALPGNPVRMGVPAELMTLDNVVLVPHIGSATVETRAAMAQRVFDNLKSYFDSGKLVSQAAA